MSGPHSSGSSRPSVAASAHCRSSRNSSSGCSGRASAATKFCSTRWKRFCASTPVSSAGAGCAPMMNSISGMTSAITPPLHAQRAGQRVAPGAEPGLALRQHLAHQAAKGLDQRAERHAAHHLVELAGDEAGPCGARSAAPAAGSARSCRCPNNLRPAASTRRRGLRRPRRRPRAAPAPRARGRAASARPRTRHRHRAGPA